MDDEIRSKQPTLACGASPPDGATYVVIFRTHFWDEFVGRQFSRAARCAGGADVFVLADETRSPVAVPDGIRKFSITDRQILDEGFPDAGEGSIQWFSGDVPLYLFRRSHPNYDFYVQLEYDVVLNVPMAQLVRRLSSDKVDLLLLSNEEIDKTWNWQATMTAEYSPGEIRHQLFCFGVFSAQAVRRLDEARADQARRFRSGELSAWPYCEGYIATEARRRALQVAELSDYLAVPNYKWWPPYFESAGSLSALGDVVHPVLDEPKYVASLLKHDIGVKAILLPFSWFNRKLMKLGVSRFLAVISSEAYRVRARTSFITRFRRFA